MIDSLKNVARRLSIPALSDKELLQAFAAILEELRSRKISRTSNNPVADYCEWLACSKLGLRKEVNSTAGFDAVDASGTKFEIKARRVTPHSSSVQLSAIRNLRARHFDYLIGVIFEVDFSIRYAAKIPYPVIEPNSRFSKHSNAHVFLFTPKVLSLPGVEEITELLTVEGR